MVLADETVELTGDGKARQLTLYQHDQPVLQVLTSETTAPAGPGLLAPFPVADRRQFKYAAEHNGIDATLS